MLSEKSAVPGKDTTYDVDDGDDMLEIFHLQLLLATFAGWANRHQAQVIEYLIEENRVLKEQLGGRRLGLTDDQRRRLAAKGKILGRRVLAQIATIVTVARNLTMLGDGFLTGMRYLILDRDSKFTAQFKRILQDADIKAVLISYQAPNMNAIAERWVLSVKSECINMMILFGEDSLRRVLEDYGAHFHQERPHQGLGNELIAPEWSDNSPTDEVIETERLGGLLRTYQRAA